MRLRTSAVPVALTILAACAAPSSGSTAGPAPARTSLRADAPPPAMDVITEADLRRDVFAMASDSMRGREAGELDEMRASMWVAERAREAGLLPAGDDGTYFQFFPLRRVRTAGNSRVSLGGTALTLARDVVVAAPVDARLDLPVVWVGEGRAAELEGVDLRGKAVAALVVPPNQVPPREISLWSRRYTQAAVRDRAAFLVERGAAAVILVSDSVSETQFGVTGAAMLRGRYALSDGTEARPAATPPVLWLPRSMMDAVRRPNQRLTAELMTESFVYPSVNVVAVAPGADTALRGEYVLFSGHQDHDGIRVPVNGDSIWNGADDNATVSVAMLAIARAFTRQPGRRSALFVWHGAEERGLLGSRWFVRHPTVPREAIAAVLNGDMIGRNHPDSAALLGTLPPHRSSGDLVDMTLRANAATARFALDSTWDATTHPEGWYFRSDHLPYACANIPSVFFTTLLHPDYHTPEDEPERIDVAKLARATRWMYATGWMAAQADQRPRVEPGFRLERPCTP
ncbi:M28 family peptidase [Longimicrobium sp.]|uniref:M28 family peptidase n=1 Tax=Longimicrobium sp. TaxID=2029185 RepID=UPI002E303433|nr:M28 family peptidase [Longimicrobium sp.]HEX6037369.1 M28 family peptidase [Longimicrobium sp.]